MKNLPDKLLNAIQLTGMTLTIIITIALATPTILNTIK